MKTKRKASPARNKPHAILHMMAWGWCVGGVLALPFAAFFMNLANQTIAETVLMLINPQLWFPVFGFGGFAGATIGFIQGLLLWNSTWDEADSPSLRFVVTVVIAISSFSLSYLLLGIVLGLNIYFDAPLLLYVPVIAGGYAAYAAKRYHLAMQLWREQAYSIQREKVKKLEAFEDKIKSEESGFPEEEKKKYETS